MIRLFLLLLFFINALALEFNNATSHYDEFELEILETQKGLKIDEVKKMDFTSHKNNFSLGYHKGDLWFRLKLSNYSDEDTFIVVLNEFFYEEAVLYYEQDKRLIKKINGLDIPLDQREVRSKEISFKLELEKNTSTTLYLRVWGKFSYFGQLNVYKESDFYKKSIFHIDSIIFFILGVIIAIAIFQIFLFRHFEKNIFLFYTLYVLFLGVYFLNITGIFVYLDMQKYLYLFHLSAPIALVFLLLFTKSYFDTKNRVPNANKILNTLLVLLTLLIVCMFFVYTPWNKILNILVGFSMIFLLLLTLNIYLSGVKKVIFFFLAILMFLVGTIIFVSMLSGVLEYNFFTRYSYIIASFFEIIILTLLISDKYNEIQAEKILIQKQLINEQNTIQEKLESEVKTRTSEIEENYKKIARLSDERALLLKEIHHRVKNNFQAVISMIWFEDKKQDSKKDLRSLINRIKSMSNIHEHIYSKKDLAFINMQEYLTQIIHNLVDSYHLKDATIDYEIEPSNLNINEAMSLGVILNELVTNSIKHSECSSYQIR